MVASNQPDDRLARLNARERAILRLLAEGHTAKTIATEMGLGLGSVNEQLRSARRKTGAGSSRELARRLRLQENRDDFIGLAAPRDQDQASGHPDVPPRRRTSISSWRPAMLIVTAAAAIALAHQAQTPPMPPLASTVHPDGPSTLALATQLRRETRDEAWASSTEAELGRAYRALPNAASAEGVTVTCGQTLCEIAGQARSDADPQSVSALVSDLQSRGAIEPALALGLKSVVAKFGAAGEPQRVSFVTYWRRGG